jgi:hypothetical protein
MIIRFDSKSSSFGEAEWRIRKNLIFCSGKVISKVRKKGSSRGFEENKLGYERVNSQDSIRTVGCVVTDVSLMMTAPPLIENAPFAPIALFLANLHSLRVILSPRNEIAAPPAPVIAFSVHQQFWNVTLSALPSNTTAPVSKVEKTTLATNKSPTFLKTIVAFGLIATNRAHPCIASPMIDNG